MIDSIGAMSKKVDIVAGATAERRGFDAIEESVIHKGVWAAIQPARGREYYESKRAANEETVKITVRYRDTINEGCKVLYKGHTYEIQSIVDPDMRHDILELYCVEKLRGAAKRRVAL